MNASEPLEVPVKVKVDTSELDAARSERLAARAGAIIVLGAALAAALIIVDLALVVTYVVLRLLGVL